MLLAGVCQLLLADSGQGFTDSGAQHPAFCRPDFRPSLIITSNSLELERNHKIDLAENEVEEELNFSKKNVQNGKLIMAIFCAIPVGFLLLSAIKHLWADGPLHQFTLYRSYIFLRVIRI